MGEHVDWGIANWMLLLGIGVELFVVVYQLQELRRALEHRREPLPPPPPVFTDDTPTTVMPRVDDPR